MGILGSTLNGFLPFYLASLNESCSFWFGLKDLFLIHTFDDNIVLGWVNLSVELIRILHFKLTNSSYSDHSTMPGADLVDRNTGVHSICINSDIEHT